MSSSGFKVSALGSGAVRTAGIPAAAPGGGPAGAQPAAVSKGYSFASMWEQNAPLEESQVSIISRLAQVAADRPMPPHVVGERPAGVGEGSQRSQPPHLEGDGAGEGVLVNSHQFYKWHSDLEGAMKSEMEEKYRQYFDTLTLHVQTCDATLAQVDSTLELFDELREQHQAVAVKTRTLHDACDRLVLEKERLVEFADALRGKLNYFDELEKIQARFHAPTMSVASAHFLPLLKRLDECISYVGGNLQYKDADVFLKKFRQLQSRALGMVRSHMLALLKNASAQVQAAMKESMASSSSSSTTFISEGAETWLLYVKFKAAAGDLKSLMCEMEGRASRPEYAQLLADCTSLYCDQRLALVAATVHHRISDYAKKEDLPTLTRRGCGYLMSMCGQEHQLFDHFFPSSSADPANLAPLIDPLCTSLYDTLRPRFIHAADLEVLCEVADILKVEVGEDQLGLRGDTAAGLRPTVMRTLADVHERLTFRAQTYMRDQEDEGRAASAEWYPPLERTLLLLSKLYRSLDSDIFTGLAQESVGLCAASIQRASKAISRKSSAMDGHLFLIKHLLVLREQIAPYDIEFAVTVKELDFSHLLDHLRRILRGQASFFSLTNGVSLARLSPRVTESSVDVKKEMEKSLKGSCEAFIMSVTKLTVEPLLSFITKVTAVKVAHSSSLKRAVAEGGSAGAISATERPLRDQAFATPEKVAEMLAKVDEALKVGLPEVVATLKLYLTNPSTRAILFKPIKSNMVEAHGQVATLIKAEYTEEDLKVIKLLEPTELKTYLDSLA